MTHRTGDQPSPVPGTIAHRIQQDAQRARQNAMLQAQQDAQRAQQHLYRKPDPDEATEYDPQGLSEDQAKFPPFPVAQNQREAIDTVLNDEADETTRVAAFRSLPMELARFLLDELGVANLKEYLARQKAYFDETKPAAWDAEVQHKAAERAQYAARRKEYDAQLGAITANEPKIPQQGRIQRTQVRENGERKMKTTHINEAGDARRPLAVVLDEYGDLLADLSSQINRLEDRLRPVLRVDEDPTAQGAESRDSCDAPAVCYAREHNTQLIRSIDALTNIIDRLEC